MRRDSKTNTFTGYTAEKLAEQFEGATVKGGVVRWNSNNNVPFEDMLTDFFEAGLISDEVLHTSNGYRKAQVSSFLDDYKIAQANRSPEQIAEEQMMARDALGNQPIANVITGEIF